MHLSTRTINTSTYYVASMAAFAVITACYNVAISLAFQRDAGVLKRTNGTPLPGAAFMGGRIVHALLISVLLGALTAAFGKAFYGAAFPTGMALLRFLIMLVVGAAAFCAVGLAVHCGHSER